MNQVRFLKHLAKEALTALQPARMMTAAMTVRGHYLVVGKQRYDLNSYQHIYVVGAGKATLAMAEAVQRLLRQRITAGYINVPVVKRSRLGTIQVQAASHPFPNAATVQATSNIVQLVQSATAEDLIICLFSGGGSSMLTLPRDGITLAQQVKLSRKLMHAGANIVELNTVRKHLSRVKGGQLVAQTAATVVGCVISDVIGDPLDVIASGPTVADPTTTKQAIQILKKYHLYTAALGDVMQSETPKQLSRCVQTIVVGSNLVALQHLQQVAKRKQIRSKIITYALQGEARVISKQLIAKALREQQKLRQPLVLLAGGETTVTVRGKGLGGRNQELALSALCYLKPGISLLSLATDGVDGFTPQPVAAAIATPAIQTLARRLQLDLAAYLAANNSYVVLRRMNALIQTGPTGTNVGDLVLILVEPKKS